MSVPIAARQREKNESNSYSTDVRYKQNGPTNKNEVARLQAAFPMENTGYAAGENNHRKHKSAKPTDHQLGRNVSKGRHWGPYRDLETESILRDRKYMFKRETNQGSYATAVHFKTCLCLLEELFEKLDINLDHTAPPIVGKGLPVFSFLDVACAPGGFSEFLLNGAGGRGICKEGYGLTLPVCRGGFPVRVEPRSNYHLFFHDLLSSPDVPIPPIPDNSVDIALADAQHLPGREFYRGPDAGCTPFKNSHCGRIALLISQFSFALAALRHKGCFVFRTAATENFPENGYRLLLLCLDLFESVRPFKSEFVHYANNSFYIVCVGFDREKFVRSGIALQLKKDYEALYYAVGPGAVGPGTIGPGTVGPGIAGSGAVGPGTVGPGTVGPGIVGSGAVGSETDGSVVVGPRAAQEATRGTAEGESAFSPPYTNVTADDQSVVSKSSSNHSQTPNAASLKKDRICPCHVSFGAQHKFVKFPVYYVPETTQHEFISLKGSGSPPPSESYLVALSSQPPTQYLSSNQRRPSFPALSDDAVQQRTSADKQIDDSRVAPVTSASVKSTEVLKLRRSPRAAVSHKNRPVVDTARSNEVLSASIKADGAAGASKANACLGSVVEDGSVPSESTTVDTASLRRCDANPRAPVNPAVSWRAHLFPETPSSTMPGTIIRPLSMVTDKSAVDESKRKNLQRTGHPTEPSEPCNETRSSKNEVNYSSSPADRQQQQRGRNSATVPYRGRGGYFRNNRGRGTGTHEEYFDSTRNLRRCDEPPSSSRRPTHRQYRRATRNQHRPQRVPDSEEPINSSLPSNFSESPNVTLSPARGVQKKVVNEATRISRAAKFAAHRESLMSGQQTPPSAVTMPSIIAVNPDTEVGRGCTTVLAAAGPTNLPVTAVRSESASKHESPREKQITGCNSSSVANTGSNEADSAQRHLITDGKTPSWQSAPPSAGNVNHEPLVKDRLVGLSDRPSLGLLPEDEEDDYYQDRISNVDEGALPNTALQQQRVYHKYVLKIKSRTDSEPAVLENLYGREMLLETERSAWQFRCLSEMFEYVWRWVAIGESSACLVWKQQHQKKTRQKSKRAEGPTFYNYYPPIQVQGHLSGPQSFNNEGGMVRNDSGLPTNPRSTQLDRFTEPQEIQCAYPTTRSDCPSTAPAYQSNATAIHRLCPQQVHGAAIYPVPYFEGNVFNVPHQDTSIPILNNQFLNHQGFHQVGPEQETACGRSTHFSSYKMPGYSGVSNLAVSDSLRTPSGTALDRDTKEMICTQKEKLTTQPRILPEFRRFSYVPLDRQIIQPVFSSHLDLSVGSSDNSENPMFQRWPVSCPFVPGCTDPCCAAQFAVEPIPFRQKPPFKSSTILPELVSDAHDVYPVNLVRGVPPLIRTVSASRLPIRVMEYAADISSGDVRRPPHFHLASHSHAYRRRASEEVSVPCYSTPLLTPLVYKAS